MKDGRATPFMYLRMHLSYRMPCGGHIRWALFALSMVPAPLVVLGMVSQAVSVLSPEYEPGALY